MRLHRFKKGCCCLARSAGIGLEIHDDHGLFHAVWLGASPLASLPPQSIGKRVIAAIDRRPKPCCPERLSRGRRRRSSIRSHHRCWNPFRPNTPSRSFRLRRRHPPTTWNGGGLTCRGCRTLKSWNAGHPQQCRPRVGGSPQRTKKAPFQPAHRWNIDR